MILTVKQIYILFDRLKWEPIYQDGALVLARKRHGGYSDDPAIAQIEAALSVMAQVAAAREKGDAAASKIEDGRAR